MKSPQETNWLSLHGSWPRNRLGHPTTQRVRFATVMVCLHAFACQPEVQRNCMNEGTPGATSECSAPVLPAAHYEEQALLYFDTLDVDAQRENVPDYASQVARWEWPPWLLLTGFGAQDMHDVSGTLREYDPSTVPQRECRSFEQQPFARCYVVFEYEGGPCPIYEEFVFNDEGQITFIEAWSDLDGLRPHRADDRWAESPDFPRLSSRIPGLGTPGGDIDLYGEWMQRAANEDDEVASFAERATDWWTFWYDELQSSPEDFFATGCGW